MTPLEVKLTEILRAHPYQSGHVANAATVSEIGDAVRAAFHVELSSDWFRKWAQECTAVESIFEAFDRMFGRGP